MKPRQCGAQLLQPGGLAQNAIDVRRHFLLGAQPEPHQRCRRRVVLPGGRVLGCGGKHAPVMRLVRPANVFARLGADGDPEGRGAGDSARDNAGP